MKVIAIKGKDKPQYTVIYPADKEISELPDEVQRGIKSLGEISSKQIRDITDFDNFTNKEIIEKIQTVGAYLQLTSITFAEISCD